MKQFNLTLTTDDGEVVESWIIQVQEEQDVKAYDGDFVFDWDEIFDNHDPFDFSTNTTIKRALQRHLKYGIPKL